MSTLNIFPRTGKLQFYIEKIRELSIKKSFIKKENITRLEMRHESF